MVKMEQRTVEEFVEDMVSDDRSLNQILIVAMCCRWKSFKDDIKSVFVKLRRRMLK